MSRLNQKISNPLPKYCLIIQINIYDYTNRWYDICRIAEQIGNGTIQK